MTLVLRFLTMGLLCAVSAQGSSSPSLLGSADYRATPERPFGWRGDGSGRFPGATPPTEWSLTKNVRWSTSVGRSYSSPILVDKLVVVSSEPDLLIALDRATGKEAWKIQVTPADLADAEARTAAAAYKAKDTGFAAATPITDGTTIYAVFANGIVRAVGLDGKPKWSAYLEAEQNTSYGRSASPVLVAGRLIVHMTHLYAMDPATGKRLWVNSDARCAYGTPAGFKAEGVDVIVTPAGDVVLASDGKGVNSGVGPSFNSSPVALDGLLYFGEREVKAVRLGAAFKDAEEWSGSAAGEIFGSPLLHDGLLFTVNAKGELYAFETKKKGSVDPVIEARPVFGEENGAQPVSYSSITLAGKHLFLVSTLGDIVVLEATREAKPVAKNKLKDGSGASPVFSGRDLFVRDGERLYCIGE